jgi:hypothetical protein
MVLVVLPISLLAMRSLKMAGLENISRKGSLNRLGGTGLLHSEQWSFSIREDLVGMRRYKLSHAFYLSF